MILKWQITIPVSIFYFIVKCKFNKNLIAESAKGSSNIQWMKTMMSKGTISDKVAAFTVTIQDNPVCNLEPLRNLVGMVKVSKKKECTAVIGNKELYNEL